MTRTLALVGLLALLAAPAAAALAAPDVHVDADVQMGGPSGSTGTDAKPQFADAPTLDASQAPPSGVEDILRLASVDAQASAEADGVGVSTGLPQGEQAGTAEDEPGMGEAIARAVMPVVEEHGTTAAATVGLLAALHAMGAWRFLGVGAFALYSRLTKSDLLDNTHRDRVYKLIQETPGLSVSEISQRTGLGWGTTVYHLDRLERGGFVANERGGLHKCYFPVGTLAREMRKGLGAVKNDTTRTVATFLLSRPGATQSELCEALGLSASAASKQVTKLEQAGLVRRERDWKTVHLFPQESLSEVLGVPAPEPVAPATPGATLVTPLVA